MSLIYSVFLKVYFEFEIVKKSGRGRRVVEVVTVSGDGKTIKALRQELLTYILKNLLNLLIFLNILILIYLVLQNW